MATDIHKWDYDFTGQIKKYDDQSTEAKLIHCADLSKLCSRSGDAPDMETHANCVQEFVLEEALRMKLSIDSPVQACFLER